MLSLAQATAILAFTGAAIASPAPEGSSNKECSVIIAQCRTLN